MALQTLNCPHCRMKSSMNSSSSTTVSRNSGYFLFVCPRCSLPLILLAETNRPPYEFRQCYDVEIAEQSIEKCGWQIVDSWPKASYRKIEAPEGVPGAIGTLFEHSQEAALKGGYDLAIMGYVRVLNMAQADRSPGKLKSPHAWILSLVDTRDLTADMKRWANRVRGLRGDAQGMKVKEAEELATFVHIVLEQLYGARSRAARFRAAAAPR